MSSGSSCRTRTGAAAPPISAFKSPPRRKPMPRIAISYRRADSSAIAGRICDALLAQYGKESVFMDIDDIPFGIDFRSHIQDVLQRTEVLIAVIGPNWLGVGADGSA